MKKQKIFILGIAMLCFAGVCGCNEDAEEVAEQTAAPVETVKERMIPEESYGTIENGVYTATAGALQMQVPTDWSVSEEDHTILVAGKEEESKDCVSVQLSEPDAKFDQYVKEDFEEHYNTVFDNFNMTDFKRIEVAGLDAIYMEYKFSKDDADIIGYQYMIDGTYTYMLGFTDVSGEMKEVIPSIVESIEICK